MPAVARGLVLPPRPYSLNGLVGLYPAATPRLTASVYDASGRNNTLTATGSPVVTASPYGPAMASVGAAPFTATAVNAAFLTPDLTYVAWINLNSLGANRCIFGGSSTNPILFINTTNKLTFTKNGSGNFAVGATSVVAGQWVHVAGTYSSATGVWMVYLNGVLNGTGTSLQTWLTTGTIGVGGGAFTILGQVADVRVYSRALPASEIYGLYAFAAQTSYLEPMTLFSAGGAHAFTKVVSISSGSNLTFRRSVGKKVAVASSSNVSAKKATAKKLLVAAHSAVSTKKAVTHKLLIAAHSAVVLKKAVAHKVLVTAQSTVAIKKAVGKKLAVAAHSAVTIKKAVTKKLSVAANSSVATKKAVAKKLAVTAHSAVGIKKAVGKKLSVAAHSVVSIVGSLATGARALTHTVSIAASSSVHLSKSVKKRVSIATGSSLHFGKAVTKRVAIAGHSALKVLKGAHLSLSLASGSAVNVTKRVSTTVAIMTASAVAVSKAIAITVAILSAGAVLITNDANKHYQMLVSIMSTSTVSVATSFFVRSIAVSLRLVGSAFHMLLFGRASRLELTGMSTIANGKFHYGETWDITGVARDAVGQVLDLTNGIVQLRITTAAAVVLDLSTPSTGFITDAVNGKYLFQISADQQITAGLTLKYYTYEVRVILQDGTRSVQNTGILTILPSKFTQFP